MTGVGAVSRGVFYFLLDFVVIGGYDLFMDSKTLIKRLESEGWQLVRVKGSHHQFKHPEKAGERVTVKHPDKDIPIGTLHSIEKQAGWR